MSESRRGFRKSGDAGLVATVAAVAVAQSLRRSVWLLLVLLVMRHYLWQHFPAELQGHAWKLFSALTILSMLAMIAPQFWPVLALWGFEELQVAICSVWWMLDPWVVPEGMAVCSAKAGIDLGAIGLLLVAWVVFRATKEA